MEREQFTFYRSFWEALKALPKKDQLPFVMAVCAYALDGESKPLSGASYSSFLLVRPVLDKANRKAANRIQAKIKSETNENQTVNKSESKENQHENKFESSNDQTTNQREKEIEREVEREVEVEKEEEKEKEIPTVSPKRNRFSPPSVEEVNAYCLERRNGIDPQKFVDFYSAKGWMIGKNPMKDWRAAVRTWENGNSESARGEPLQTTTNPFLRMLMEEEKHGQSGNFENHGSASGSIPSVLSEHQPQRGR